MKSSTWNKIVAGLLMAPLPMVARAEVYLTESQAVKAIFPSGVFQASTVDLTPEQIHDIQKRSGEKPLAPQVRFWRAANGDLVIMDRVLGKHELITYAVGIRASGSLEGIEIMEYHETYGYEVRQATWRKQFAGKSSQDQLQLGKDILNISGATLSSKHVTDGVRRLLQTAPFLR